jgi:ABC-2 type transport system ATP-binding protein
MPQHLSVVPGLTVAEQVAYAGWLSGRSRKDAQRAAEAALDRVDLGHKAQSRPAHLSGGELRRVGLAEALTKPADLLMLDEPTAGLDPAQRDHFRALLVSLEMPLVVSTHQFDDVDQVFDHVAVIEGGALVFEGSVSTFLEYGDPTPASRQAESAFLNVTAARR